VSAPVGDLPQYKLLIEKIAMALAEYQRAELSDKHRTMAIQLLRNKAFMKRREPEIDTLVG
jgi:hypothetical protein